MADGSPMTFAGIWETWKGEEKPIESCAIITTDANELASKIHNRMPVILTGADRQAWLDDEVDPDGLTELLTPFAGNLDACQVAPLVNNVRNHGPELIVPA
jgi:putative SOS response-associated peptidase YedK